ncbi:MAG: aspartate carbamoyltransferase [Phycisphaerae bacterium]|nr:aspartate carbamoyltransferase [Phycisphaerae bacterium]|tara:strand:- start:1783 stop:2733 length:951 start_codon:yes stop_codon:yes gene_type:complete
MGAPWNKDHLLGLEELDRDQLLTLLEDASSLLPIARNESPARTDLAGQIIATLFFENSTRTRMSFTLAARKLGADILDLNASTSSTAKGETLLDTALNIEAMGVDAMVMRCAASGGPQLVADHVQVPIINAGDGRHEHPTQGLLDALTLQQHFGRTTLEDLTIAIVGDIASSRVARSNAFGLTTLGADVILAGPESLVPAELETLVHGRDASSGTLRVEHDLDAVLDTVDAIMMLRVQFERHGGEGIGADYTTRYGLTVDRASRLRPDVPVLHPGPVNRGIEIDPEVVDGDRSLILDQVTCGVAARMAVLRGLLSK